ncbi:cytidine deaminase [Parabacteroides sp. PH5-13]|uniref:cytidine deaminase n=1 Tax=unclassified Parabacteroides TaxID=2649774 RepID=UPI002474916A|nr:MULTISPECIES: cytidine deaminase [unclassified Parabacteroides]MDH6304231.1 cytidine deaminase [Parabacteroides sp. PH5-39]MDH6318714.1 cytidine deaminase [Parabacteroides sp. PH5-13]MDH6322444.1 cytidine deaminase [Parabacteroides sp. PH5-8]MDH6383731.1 cytidine deaminase [Parabacteroides sp. PH5-17]MDH6392935.1 cytidine deaminase [Parabacteroides sp. PFB2-22]
MKELVIETKIRAFAVAEVPEEYKILLQAALEATGRAYAPYSRFQVGAAVLLSDGKIVAGNNQENAAYPSGLCAERVALFSAGAQYPDLAVKAIAIAAVTEGSQVDMITPCGGCRQVLLEVEKRYQHPVNVLLYGKDTVYVADSASALLPLSFDGSDLPEH